MDIEYDDKYTSSDYDPIEIAKEEKQDQENRLALYYALKDLESYPDKIASGIKNALSRQDIAEVIKELNEYLEI